MIIEEGKRYVDNNGDTHGPMRRADISSVYSSGDGSEWRDHNGHWYSSEGRFYSAKSGKTDPGLDLIGELGQPPIAVGMTSILSAVKPSTNIYLSGPMKGYPESNYPLFNTVAALLRKAGFEVYNPAEFEHDEAVFPLRKAFAEYSKFICEKADIIVLLPAWDKSLGVSAELALAKNCGLRVVELKDAILGIDSLLVV
jgi:hypothetical protein